MLKHCKLNTSYLSWFFWLFIPLSIFNINCTKENLSPYEYASNSVDIKELILDCNASQLAAMANFWNSIMGLDLLASGTNSFSVQAGSSRLTIRRGQFGGIFHFTFDVPENQIENAREWILKRAKIVKDAQTGAEILHKSKFNSHSLFFHDPAGNLVEFSAKHNLKNSQQGDFNEKMILGITNVTIVTRNVKNCTDLFYNNFQIQQVEGTSNSVKVVGGNQGNVTFQVPKRPYFPTEDLISFSYKLELVIRHPSEQAFKLPGCEATVRSEP